MILALGDRQTRRRRWMDRAGSNVTQEEEEEEEEEDWEDKAR